MISRKEGDSLRAAVHYIKGLFLVFDLRAPLQNCGPAVSRAAIMHENQNHLESSIPPGTIQLENSMPTNIFSRSVLICFC